MDLTKTLVILAVGLFLITMNWMIVYSIYVKKKNSSWVPLLGGLCLAIGIWRLPYEPLHGYAWLAFVIDYGCLPALVQMIYFFLSGGHKSPQKNLK